LAYAVPEGGFEALLFFGVGWGGHGVVNPMSLGYSIMYFLSLMNGSRVDGASTRKEGVGLFAIGRLQTRSDFTRPRPSVSYLQHTTLITTYTRKRYTAPVRAD
jgi:hypothetical protein